MKHTLAELIDCWEQALEDGIISPDIARGVRMVVIHAKQLNENHWNGKVVYEKLVDGKEVRKVFKPRK